jgi:4-oxalocrotonate tautomerase family enzyme
MSETLGVPLERIRVAIYEVSSDEWGIGGEPFSAARPGGVAPPAP